MGLRYVICRCGAVYARTVEPLDTHRKGSFACGCGVTLGAWNGLLELRYARLSNADRATISTARRAG